MAVRIAPRSRLQLVDLLTVDGVEFWDLGVFEEIPVVEGEQRHQVLATDRIDLLAFDYYGDERLWPIIALANYLEDMPTELVVGMKLRIPSEAWIKARLFRR